MKTPARFMNPLRTKNLPESIQWETVINVIDSSPLAYTIIRENETERLEAGMSARESGMYLK
jgi:hypothetical protein